MLNNKSGHIQLERSLIVYVGCGMCKVEGLYVTEYMWLNICDWQLTQESPALFFAIFLLLIFKKCYNKSGHIQLERSLIVYVECGMRKVEAGVSGIPGSVLCYE